MGRRRDKVASRIPATGDLFAEAHPERVLVEEEYHYSQEISANRWTERGDAPSGRIDIRVPYDGVRHLPRSTAKALARWLDGDTDKSDATIGHVVIADHQHTDLGDHLDLDRNSGAIPVRIPVRSPSLTGADALSSDRREYRWSLDYAPEADHPELIPLQLTAEVEDTDTSGLHDIISELVGGRAQRDFVTAMTQYIAFRPALTLSLTASVTVTLPRDRHPRHPKVRRVAVEMPAMTSMSGRRLRLSVAQDDHPLHYDAHDECMEWFDVPMRASESNDDTSSASSDHVVRRSYQTHVMRLDIDQPGELFARDELGVRVEVEMPDVLLSGAQVRLFDARGRWSGGRRPARTLPRRTPTPDRPAETAFRGRPRGGGAGSAEPAAVNAPTKAVKHHDTVVQRTVIRTQCAVSLRDAFARRAVRPHQSLHFDEIIPTAERVADVEAVLTSLGFKTTRTDLLERWDGRDPDEMLWVIQGERGDQVGGDNAAQIWIVVRGRRHSTRRQSERAAGTRYTTRVATGEIELFVRGTTLGNSVTLMEQMNALHRRLKDRFRPMRSQR